MTLPLASARQLDVAQKSYERCQKAPAFFATLYEALLASDPAVPPLFAKTEFPRQHKLLQHGLGLLLSYARRANPALLERIAARHGPADMNIPSVMYPAFVNSLIVAVRTHDPEFDAGIEEAWRASVAPGIKFMQVYGQ